SYNGNITRIESTDIGKNINQYIRLEMMEEDILYYDVINHDNYEDTIAASSSESTNISDNNQYEIINKDIILLDDNNTSDGDDLSDNLIKGLQLLYIKEKHTLSDKAFNEIMTIFGLLDVSLFKLRKNLENIIPIKPKLVDMCWNSCCAYIGKDVNCNTCFICGEPWYIPGRVLKQPQKSAAYFSVIDSLRIQYKDPSRAMIFQYQHEYISSEEYISNNDKIEDVIDGNQYKSLPQGYDRTNYNPENLPMHTHISYLQDIEAIENEIGGTRTRIQRERDINEHSILLELRSIDFPASFPIDIMHALFENIASHMF
ncbi:9895_t:CDS:2, partial [Funneliformis geosporum]